MFPRQILLNLLLVLATIPLLRARSAESPDASGRRIAQLKELVPLPKSRTQINPSFQAPYRFTFNGEPLDHGRMDPPAQRIANLRGQLATHTNPGALWLEIRDTRLRMNDEAGVREAALSAEIWFREKLAMDPSNARTRVGLAESLPVSRRSEAVALMREASRLAPQDAEVWAYLGWQLAFDCQEALDLITELPSPDVTPSELARLQRQRAERAIGEMPPERLRALRAQFAEARDAFDQAVRASVPAPLAVAGRWTFDVSIAPVLHAALMDSSGWRDVTNPSRMFSREALEGIRPGIRCAAQDPFAVLQLGFLATTAALGENRDQLMSRDLTPLLGASDRQFLEEWVALLQEATRSSDPKVQRGARLGLAAVRAAVHADPGGAVPEALAAARLLPQCGQAWELTLGCAALAGWTTNALPLADEALSHIDTAPLRLSRGRFRMSSGDLDGAESDLRKAWIGSRVDESVRLGLVCVLLRRGSESDLNEAGALLHEFPAPPAGREAMEPELSFVRAIHFGLVGRVPEGRAILRQLLAAQPTDTRIHRALEAFR